VPVDSRAPFTGSSRSKGSGGRAGPYAGTSKGTKRARQYEHIKESERKQGRSESHAEEIAAHTVNKQRAG
jgi:hypothetical protein